MTHTVLEDAAEPKPRRREGMTEAWSRDKVVIIDDACKHVSLTFLDVK